MAEAVLLAARVRMKKREGTAEFTEKQLRWVPDASSGISTSDKPVVVPWASVQEQQVSSATSPRAMLRLRTAGGAALVLEFVSARSLAHAFEARDAAKELVARLLAAGPSSGQQTSRRAAPLCNAAEIKQRAALLAANPTLKRQHTEMVTDGLIAEEDFWASRRHLLANEASKRQKTAKTSAILTDLSGDSDAGNVVKYNLNAEVIHQIFIQYPAVHLAYEAQVPDKMTETEFWSTFFKSKYFHRDRKAGHDDLFSKYEEKERALARTATVDPRAVVDPLVDLTATEEDLSALQRALVKKALPGGGGGGTGAAGKDDSSSITIAKFNRHGAYVLDPSHAGKLQANPETTTARPKYQDNLAQATLLDDLQGKVPPPYNPLTLEDESRYFQQQQTQSGGATVTGSLEEAAQRFKRVCSAPIPLAKSFPSARSSLDILSEIVACSESGVDGASGGSSGAFGSGAMTADFIPTEFKKQVYNQFHDVNELLRHFLSFKAKVAQGGDPHAQAKLDKIVDRMGSKYDELVKIRENLPPHEKNLLAPLLKPFDDQLNLAFI